MKKWIVAGLAGSVLGASGYALIAPVIGQTSSAPLPRVALQSDTFATIAQQAMPAVVNIDTVTRELNPFGGMFGSPFQTERGVGSGFLIDPNGLIVTNEHVIEGAQTVTITLTNGKRYKGRRVGTDPISDVALVKIEAKNLPILRFGDSNRMRVGDWVVAMGSPLGLQKTVTAGIISATEREIALNERINFIQTDAAINPGNSGGPLLNLLGEVIGVNNAIAARAQGIGFAIPSNLVRDMVNQLVAKGRVDRPWMGVALQAIPDEGGVLIAGVNKGSPAAQAGLRPGDVLLALDGRPMNTPGQAVQYLSSKKIGDRLSVTFRRGNQTMRATVVLRPMPVSVSQQRPE